MSGVEIALRSSVYIEKVKATGRMRGYSERLNRPNPTSAVRGDVKIFDHIFEIIRAWKFLNISVCSVRPSACSR
jgi:hypothetical protein